MLTVLLAAVAGALTAWLGFAPVGWWWFPYLGFAVLAVLIARTSTVRRGALLGFAFGLAYFVVGVSWVRVSMHEFGGMPLPLAWFSAILFCAFLALYPTLACAFTAWTKPRNPVFFAFVFASAWTFAEYLRAHLFTGFEWLSVGVSQVGPFAPSTLAALLGHFAMGFVVLATAGYIVAAGVNATEIANGAVRRWAAYWVAVAQFVGLFLFLGWFGFVGNAFTSPIGKQVQVSLLQGNVPQSMKWEPEKFVQTLQLYEKLVTQAKGELIILPETALPAPLSRIPPEYIEKLRGIAFSKNANLLIGVPVDERGKYYNAAVSMGVEDAQQYRKVHLVPFGEYMPLRGPLAWFYANLTIPMSDFSAGDAMQAPIRVNGQVLGISICYEDAFARDVLRTMPDATLLVNISNDAWFGKSAAAEQHLQLAQMRAIETGRPMLRANNTGITAVIDDRGRVTQRLEPWTEGILEATVQGRKGATPYTMWGDLPILLICLAGIGVAAAHRLRRRGPSSE
ncbi:MAG: apolipoprotein N-acyltransferase [Burkholderiales bacterium]|nr:apolipoprotein N-acyltransferase [Burkholderiales bacterium]